MSFKTTIDTNAMDIAYEFNKKEILQSITKEDKKIFKTIVGNSTFPEFLSIINKIGYIPTRLGKYNIDTAYIIAKSIYDSIES